MHTDESAKTASDCRFDPTQFTNFGGVETAQNGAARAVLPAHSSDFIAALNERRATFNGTIERLKRALQVETDADVCRVLQMSTSAFANRKRGGGIPYREIVSVAIARRLDVSSVFLDETLNPAPAAETVTAVEGMSWRRVKVRDTLNRMRWVAGVSSDAALARLLRTSPKNISNWCVRGAIPELYMHRWGHKFGGPPEAPAYIVRRAAPTDSGADKTLQNGTVRRFDPTKPTNSGGVETAQKRTPCALLTQPPQVHLCDLL